MDKDLLTAVLRTLQAMVTFFVTGIVLRTAGLVQGQEGGGVSGSEAITILIAMAAALTLVFWLFPLKERG